MSGPHVKSDIGILSDEQIQFAARRPQAVGRKARLGFIGAGWWATTNHMPLLKARRDVELVCVCGLDRALNERIQRDFGFAHTTTDYRELLKHKLDGVIVASPHSLHAEHAAAALEAGCHVMIEKPMTTRADDARRIVRLAREKTKHILVPYGWHYRPLTVRAKQLMSQRVVGDIEHVVCVMSSPGKNLFAGKSFDFLDSSYVAANLSTYTDPAISGGGYGQGQLSHAAGLIVWLTGLTGESVFALMNNANCKTDMYDALSVRFTSGATGAISGAATVPPGAPFQMDIRIFGSNGMLLYDIERERLEFHSHDGEHRIIPVTPGDGAYRCNEPPHEFVELILGLTSESHAPGEVALHAVELIDAAYRSATSGQLAKIDGGAA